MPLPVKLQVVIFTFLFMYIYLLMSYSAVLRLWSRAGSSSCCTSPLKDLNFLNLENRVPKRLLDFSILPHHLNDSVLRDISGLCGPHSSVLFDVRAAELSDETGNKTIDSSRHLLGSHHVASDLLLRPSLLLKLRAMLFHDGHFYCVILIDAVSHLISAQFLTAAASAL